MKIVFDTVKNVLKVGSKTFGFDMTKQKEEEIICNLKNFIKNNTKITDYEEDSMWMSYRYCIGRHTIAAHMRARDIAQECYGRLSQERSIFTAYDINREIERCMSFGFGPSWHFPITSFNKIYTTAIDIFCQFIEDYNIKSKEDYLKYYTIDVILTDNERGYKIETTTWDEKLHSLIPIFKEQYNVETIEEIINLIKELRKNSTDDIDSRIRWIIKSYPNTEHFYFHDIEDLFVWNNLCHLFDLEHHHKSVLVDGTECEWYWTYTHDTEFGYKKIRVPVDTKMTTFIDDESIINDLY